MLGICCLLPDLLMGSVPNGTGLSPISRIGQGWSLRAVRSVVPIGHPSTCDHVAWIHPTSKAGGFHFHPESCRTLFRTAWKAIPANSGLIPCHSGLSLSDKLLRREITHIPFNYIPVRTVQAQRLAGMAVKLHMRQRLKPCPFLTKSLPTGIRAIFPTVVSFKGFSSQRPADVGDT